MGTIVRLRHKPVVLARNTNPYIPSRKAIDQFRIPEKLSIQNLAGVASTIALSELGIVIPHCKYPERFEAGLRHGLAYNRRTDVKTQFRVLFSQGFCWAKMFYKKFSPNHPLAAPGSQKMRISQDGGIHKIKDV